VDLTDAEIASYGLDPSTKRDTTSVTEGLGGPACRWTNRDIQVFFTAGRTVASFKGDKRYASVKPVRGIQLTELR